MRINVKKQPGQNKNHDQNQNRNQKYDWHDAQRYCQNGNQKFDQNDPYRTGQKRVMRGIIGVSFLTVSVIIGIYISIMTGNETETRRNNTESDERIANSISGESNGGAFSESKADIGTKDSFSTILSGNAGWNSSDETVSMRISRMEEGAEENDIYFPLKIEPARTNEMIESTTNYFTGRIPVLQKTLAESGFFYMEKLLDPNTATKAYVIAKNKNCAENLNGYFYYLLEEKGSAAIVSPFVLNISLLFEEENRKIVTDSGIFAETRHSQALKQSLIAILGIHYSEEVFGFIMEEYRRTFQSRMAGEPLQTPVFKLQQSKLEVVFHNSFLTYVEFYIHP